MVGEFARTRASENCECDCGAGAPVGACVAGWICPRAGGKIGGRIAPRIVPANLKHIFFSDDGSTAVEVSLKMALQYWRNVGQPEKSEIVALQQDITEIRPARCP